LPSKGKGHYWTKDDGIGKRFPRRVEHAFDVTIQRSHHAYPGEHRLARHVPQPAIAPASGLAILRHHVFVNLVT
jgi:hypothetical protein